MTADLTPAQAARLEEIEAAPWAEEALQERLAVVLCNTDAGAIGYRWDELEPTPYSGIRDAYRRLAVAAIDVMRGATVDGAVGRVLVGTEWAVRAVWPDDEELVGRGSEELAHVMADYWNRRDDGPTCTVMRRDQYVTDWTPALDPR